jgi:FixJ family two-component response regulator
MPGVTQSSKRKSKKDRASMADVCLVDDDASVRTSIGRLLASAGFKVRAFSEAASFLEYVARTRVRLVVLDIWMEHMTGMEVLAHLCSKSPQTRVIFITGHRDSAAERTVMQAGAFGFLLKPFDSEQLLSLVQRALR